MQIFIGNVYSAINQDYLRKELEKYGKVETIEIVEKSAFVEMPYENEATLAIMNLNNNDINGIKINVHKARKSESDRRKSGRIGGRRSHDPKNYTKMFSRKDIL
ncbi:MAG: hypothetical protein P9L97_02730 [Candidatus Tenebribacter davisii]|jgi:RNA recognition motif-containing protein|nr:hypothetical protein [Candidatus Tenebribacter davisii]